MSLLNLNVLNLLGLYLEGPSQLKYLKRSETSCITNSTITTFYVSLRNEAFNCEANNPLGKLSIF